MEGMQKCLISLGNKGMGLYHSSKTWAYIIDLFSVTINHGQGGFTAYPGTQGVKQGHTHNGTLVH